MHNSTKNKLTNELAIYLPVYCYVSVMVYIFYTCYIYVLHPLWVPGTDVSLGTEREDSSS